MRLSDILANGGDDDGQGASLFPLKDPICGLPNDLVDLFMTRRRWFPVLAMLEPDIVADFAKSAADDSSEKPEPGPS